MAPGSESHQWHGRPARWPALVTFAVVLAAWLAAPHLLPLFVDSGSDTYSALDTLFSGLAFAGVVWTVILQSRELELQRVELVANREEMARARAESARTASAQEDAARLAALVALIAHETERVNRFREEAFDEIDTKDGAKTVVIDDRAAADFKEALAARFRYLDDLKATYARIAETTGASEAISEC